MDLDRPADLDCQYTPITGAILVAMTFLEKAIWDLARIRTRDHRRGLELMAENLSLRRRPNEHWRAVRLA
jgi:hypothetical protein